MSKIRVIDNISGQVLKEFELAESEKAYEYAAEMEEIGLDIAVNSPTITRTLSTSLGASPQRIEEMEKSAMEEIEDHEGSCCVKRDDEPLH